MNKEELQEKIIKDEVTYDYLKDEVHILYEENKKLKQKYNLMKTNANQLAKRIDKAIEYIEQEKKKDEEDSFVDLYLDKYEEDLLKILKGEDK